MRDILLGAAILVGVAVMAPGLLQSRIDAAPPATPAPAQPMTAARAEPAAPRAVTSGRQTRLEPDARGHFLTEARFNGRPVTVMVDTGATTVAINESTARRIGLRLTRADFRHRVNTANGQTEAAAATIGEIRIGGITVRDVQAAVLRDSALDGTLLGMSFLSRLKRFTVEDGALVMTE